MVVAAHSALIDPSCGKALQPARTFKNVIFFEDSRGLPRILCKIDRTMFNPEKIKQNIVFIISLAIDDIRNVDQTT